MPKIVNFGGVNSKDLRENPAKALWQKFQSLDRFRKIALIIGVCFIIFAIYASFNLLETRQQANLGPGRIAHSCDNGDYTGCLSSQFSTKIDFSLLEATPSAEQQQQTSKYFYDNLSIPLSYIKYLDMFKSVGGVNIVLADAVNSNGSGPRGSLAMVPRRGKIVFYPRFFTRTEKAKKAIVIHETGHVIAGSSDGRRLQNELYQSVYTAGLDAECFSPRGVIKTYAIPPRLPKSETFAESILNTLVCAPGERCLSVTGPEAQAISDFPASCVNTYNFVRANVLGLPAPTPTPVPPTPTPVEEAQPTISPEPTIVEDNLTPAPEEPSVSPSPGSTNYSPIGNQDSATCEVISGWACDRNEFSRSLDIHIYADSPAGPGRSPIANIRADQAREQAVGNLCGGNSSHGFRLNTPQSLKDGKAHTIYAYAINVPAGANKLLSGSPKTMAVCSTTPTRTPTSAPIVTRQPLAPPPPDDPAPEPVIASATLLPIADAHVRSDYSDRNFGTQIYSRSKAKDPHAITYLKFNLRPYAGLNIRKATLKIRVSSVAGSSSTGEFRVRRVGNRRWGETTVTYNTKPALSETLATFRPSAQNTTYEIDLTAWAKNQAGRRASLGIDTISEDLAIFNTKGHSGIKPTLVVEYEEAQEVVSETE